ncbi:hypothetical protein Acsp06_60130 [Actinomycetospora sp. NBRC 106375]|nr:hypothetical protein Acsp06_60130 [Actinomycetospora sp. NBRC 106375]
MASTEHAHPAARAAGLPGSNGAAAGAGVDVPDAGAGGRPGGASGSVEGSVELIAHRVFGISARRGGLVRELIVGSRASSAPRDRHGDRLAP